MRQRSARIVLDGLFLFSLTTGLLAPSLAARAFATTVDNEKPVFTGAYPMEIKVRPGPGNLEMRLTGSHLTITGDDRLWDSREMLLYVRHSSQSPAWQLLYNNLRGEGYPNGALSSGECNYQFGEDISVTLPLAVWASTPGFLEFKLTKTKLTSDGGSGWVINTLVESDVLRVPVKASVGPTSHIQAVHPNEFRVNQATPPALSVYGDWAPGSVLLLDGVKMAMMPVNAVRLLEGVLPPGFLNAEAKHELQVVDPQQSYSPVTVLWVYAPPKVLHTQPSILTVGMGDVWVWVKYSGPALDTVEGKVAYVYSVAPAGGGQTKIAAPLIPAAPARGGIITRRVQPLPAQPADTSGSGDAQAKPWMHLTYEPKEGEARIVIPGAWMKQVGTVKVRLTSKSGSTEFVLPIKAQQ
jgi:hypothetical protein